MMKRTLYFGNPAYLKTKHEQLVIELLDTGEIKQVPIEDIGIVTLDNQQITITHGVISKLIANNVALITCDNTHHPTGLTLNLDGNTLQSQKFRAQIEAALPLKKQLWQQTIISKVSNQATILSLTGKDNTVLKNYAKSVKSGDSTNVEAKAAIHYWKHLYSENIGFSRDRYGPPPNNLLNYGYAILRATVARSLVGSGLLPTLGIFHRNQYNAYCLADDIMEPYRPIVDLLVYKIFHNSQLTDFELTPDIKKELLSIPALDVSINLSGNKEDTQSSPLMVAVQHTTSSLSKCFENKSKRIVYPTIEV